MNFKMIWQRITQFLKGYPFLCDSCKYDYRTACQRPERPNATLCPDYKKR
ncbi:MAG: hypothetical protein AB1567_01320 [bacterium]